MMTRQAKCGKGHDMTGENRLNFPGGSTCCRICRHRPNKFHIWEKGRCTVCRKWKLGTLERRIADFWAKVKKSSGCWEWTGHRLVSCGYGQVSWKGKRELTHRVSWILANGPIPKGRGYHGTEVMHTCDNYACLRPDHLTLGTQKENIADMVRKGRSAVGKLKPSDVREIRRLIAKGIMKKEIAKTFSVDRQTVGRIASGRSWAAVM